MKPRTKKQNEHDVAVMDLSSEFEDCILNDYDYIDIDARAELDDDDCDEIYF
jgi:hypothetical protein